MAKELYLFGKETTQRIATAVKQVESHPPTKPTGRGANGRPKQIIGKITAAGSSAGYYDVVQEVWNGSAWANVASGLTWDGEAGNLPEVYEINGLEGLAADTIVFPYLVGATDGTFQWVFNAGGDAGPTEPPAFDTVGVNTEGTEAAMTDEWDYDTTVNGLELYEMTRVGYFHAGDEKLYGYIRKKEYDASGRLLRVSTETRIIIDTPELFV